MSVSPACPRVLLVDDESALVFALSEYLAFRGSRVDGAEGIEDARVLVHHLHYDAVVVGVNDENLGSAHAFAVETRRRLPLVRLVALAPEPPTGAPRDGELAGFDLVFARHLPTVQLARVLCHSIAA